MWGAMPKRETTAIVLRPSEETARTAARNLWLAGESSESAIAKLVQFPVHMVKRWRIDDRWDTMKQSAVLLAHADMLKKAGYDVKTAHVRFFKIWSRAMERLEHRMKRNDMTDAELKDYIAMTKDLNQLRIHLLANLPIEAAAEQAAEQIAQLMEEMRGGEISIAEAQDGGDGEPVDA